MVPFPVDYLDEEEAAHTFIDTLWPELAADWRSLTTDDLSEFRKWETFEHELIAPHRATIAGLRIAVEQALQSGDRTAEYASLKAVSSDNNGSVNLPFVWIAMRALQGTEIVRRLEVPFAAWDQRLGKEGGFVATLVLELLDGVGSGQVAQEAGNALRVPVDERFRHSMQAAWEAAVTILKEADQAEDRDARWSIQGANGPIEGASASGAAALGWYRALSETVPDPSLIVIAEAKQNGDLCGVDAVGFEAKLRAVRADGRWDTVAVSPAQAAADESASRVPALRTLVDLRSKLTSGAISWLRGLADALDDTGWYFEGKSIPASKIAVDAFVYTKPRVNIIHNRHERDGMAEQRASLPLEDPAARFYEAPLEAEQREKLRWHQTIERPLLRLGVRGAPGGGKTFLTRNSTVALARESAELVENRKASPYDAPVPFWLSARALATSSHIDPADIVVNASRHSLAQADRQSETILYDWLLKAVTSPSALIIVDALDELVAADVESFKLSSKRLDTLAGRLIATCRTMQWDERAAWLGWPRLVDVDLAPFDAREQHEFSANFPSEPAGRNVLQLLAANYPLRQACRCPLLLTFVCLLNTADKNVVESNRATLYLQIVRELLSGRWRNSAPVWISNQVLEERILNFLEKAAWKIFNDAPEANHFTLVQWNSAGDPPCPNLLEMSIQCGILVPVGIDSHGDRCWSFMHRTLIEFLAARALSRQPNKIWLSEAKKHFWYQPEWIEVLTFLAAQLPDATPLVQSVLGEREDIFYSMLCLRSRLTAAATHVEPAMLNYLADDIGRFVRSTRREIEYRQDVDDMWRNVFHAPLYLQKIAHHILEIIGGSQVGNAIITSVLPLLKDRDELKRQVEAAMSDQFPPGFRGKVFEFKKWIERDLKSRAALILGRLGDIRAVEWLLESLAGWDETTAALAAETLGQLGDHRAVGPLFNLLWNKDETLEAAADQALRQFSGKFVVDPLLEMLRSSEVQERARAVNLLAKLGDRRAVQSLLEMLPTSPLSLKTTIVEALGQLGDSTALGSLRRLANTTDASLHKKIALSLGRLGDHYATQLLLTILRGTTTTWDERAQVVEVMGRLGDITAVEPLIGILQNSTDQFCRGEAAEVLGLLGDARAIEPLTGMLTDKHSIERGMAVQALGRLGDKHSIEPILAMVRDPDENVREMVAEALGKLGDPRAVNLLIPMLRDADPWVRASVAEALGRLGDPRAIGPLLVLQNATTRAGQRRVNSKAYDWNAWERPQRELKLVLGNVFRALRELANRNRVHVLIGDNESYRPTTFRIPYLKRTETIP